MSDRELIIHFLEKAEKRARSNKRFNDIAITLAIAFVVPVVFKLLDLYFLFRGRTVVIFLGVWAITTLIWILMRWTGKSSLNHIAGSIDSKAHLNDQLKTAYWFIQNPRESRWVDAQIRYTANTTGKLRLDTLFPRRFPRASWLVAGLLFVLVALNFVPLSLNYNWFALQAAPPFRLTEEERKSLRNALELLEKARAAENAAIAEKIEDLIENLEQGNISVDEAVKQLEELQEELEAGDLDAENMANGLGQMAVILRQARSLQTAAQQMIRGDLGAAAEQIHQLGEGFDSIPPADLREMAEKLLQASERPRSGLQDLARAFETTGAAVQKGDRAASRAGLERISQELESLAQQLADQELRSKAGDELGDLVEALEEGATDETGEAMESSKTGGPNTKEGQPSPGEAGEPGEQEVGEAPPGEQAEAGEGGEGEPGGEAGEPGDNSGGQSDVAADGKGGNAFGGSTKSAPLEGEATILEVQLQKEALKVEAGEGQEPQKDLEAAGEQERSKLDYRNAPSNLTPAQKDLLSQERIPWESRQLIKNYFQAVKPTTQTK
ncbi:MAG TPA: hypothetical protein VFR18_20395 [Terriglobia bacterium]|nr:hypothetical protein [Terriglobia bacterium]